MMREIDARVTGFDYTTFHAYTTEVEVDGRTWTLGIRYNTFFQFYTRLTALEKHFKVDFPPKGGLFFSPPPEERQEQLDDFMLSTLAYFDMRGHPRRMEALLGELLQIPEHLDIKDDDERTASEGSSVAEELLLDTPMPGHDDAADDFLDSGMEDDVHEDNQVEEDKDEDDHQKDHAEDNHQDVEVAELETKPAVQQQQQEEKQDAVEVEAENNQQVTEAMPSPKSEIKVQPLEEGAELKDGSVAKSYIAVMRRKTLVNGAIQAAVVSTMKQNVEKAKATKTEKDVDDQKAAEEIKKEEPIAMEEVATPELEAKPETPVVDEESVLPVESTSKTEITASATPPTEAISEAPVAVLEVSEVVTTVPEEVAVEPVVASAPSESPIETHLEKAPVAEQDAVAEDSAPSEAESEPAAATALVSVQEEVSSTSEKESEEEAVPEPSKEEAESENPVVGWFRRMGSTFGPSPAEKEALEEQEAAAAAKKEQEEQEATAAAKKEQEEKEAAAQAVAAAKTAAETAKAAKAAARAEAEEAELLRAEQELNLRLKPYRHPVFFQGFNCDVGTSRYSLPARLSDGIVV